MEVEFKLISVESDCQICEDNFLTFCENAYNKHIQDQIVFENLQTLLVRYWFKLKSSYFHVLTCSNSYN
jgi:hypothetical protein